MKICLINNLYGRFARGGAEAAVSGYARALEAAGHKIFIITILPRGESATENREKIYYLRGLASSYTRLGRLPFFLRFIWQLANLFNLASSGKIIKILRQEKPDLVLTHNLMGIGFLTPLAIRFLKIRHYHFLHDIQLLHPSGLIIYGEEKIVDTLFARVYQAITKKLFGSPEKIISPSAWLLHEHDSRKYFSSSEKIVLPNPLSDSNLTAKKLLLNRGKAKFKFIYVGQIERHKGVLFLAETFAKLNSDLAELVIIGNGSQTQLLEKTINANQNIKFLGRVSREEVLTAMSQADCLVVPSLCYENAPSVIFEAFASGLPVIASAVGGIPELITDHDFLFKPGDINGLSAKLIWAIEQPSQFKDRFEDLRKKQTPLNPIKLLDQLGL